MTKEQAKQRAGQLYDQGKWLQLAILIAQFGIELIQYLRERIKQKKNATNTDTTDDQGRTDGTTGKNIP